MKKIVCLIISMILVFTGLITYIYISSANDLQLVRKEYEKRYSISETERIIVALKNHHEKKELPSFLGGSSYSFPSDAGSNNRYVVWCRVISVSGEVICVHYPRVLFDDFDSADNISLSLITDEPDSVFNEFDQIPISLPIFRHKELQSTLEAVGLMDHIQR